MRDLLKHWIDDAAATTDRIRDDVAHLRSIGRQATAAAKLTAGVAKAKLEDLARQTAAKIVAFEATTRGAARGRTR